jgi:uncharacterized membrane protein
MGQRVRRWIVGLLLANAAWAVAQTNATGSGSPQANAAETKAPEMVCWGNGPSWSVQFAWWGARYLGVTQPDQDFRGRFIWNSDDAAWVWQGTNGLSDVDAPNLSAVIRKTACVDPVAKKTFPYSAQVGLPQGDQVGGCCRELKAGEAPVGPRGVPSSNSPE